MQKKRLFSLVLWSAFLMTGGAFADVSSPQASGPDYRAAAAQDDVDDAEIDRVVALSRTTPVPLTRAMAIAERLHAGSKTADISFEISGSPAYRVRTIWKDRVWVNVIDAATGKPADDEVTSSLKDLDAEDVGNIAALRETRQAMSDAVQVAEKTAAGNALSGWLTRQDGKLNFVIVVASGNDLKGVMLEPPDATKPRGDHH